MNWLEPIGARIVPANYGPLRGFNAHARVEGSCGDIMEFWLRMDGVRIQHASFITDGCETSVASGSVAAHLAQGKTIGEMRVLRPLEVLEALGLADSEDGAEAHHCADLALQTLDQAIKAYEQTLRAKEEAQHSCGKSCGEECCDSCEAVCAGEKDCPLGSHASPAGASHIRKRILVLSGKGGVGKSTVAVNLAMAFAAEGCHTGLLDVDIHGPSVPKLLGLEGARLEIEGPNLLPVERGNLKVMSMGFALETDQAAIWRGPMKASVISQFVDRTYWGDLDLLVVDCPPGTGDEVLSIAQTLGRVDGVIIVTTPQELATLDARKAITFCKKLDLPILGVVENMSEFICPECGTATPIFRKDGGRRMAENLGVPFLGALPIDPEVGESGDIGQPKLYKGDNKASRMAFQKILHPLMATMGRIPA